MRQFTITKRFLKYQFNLIAEKLNVKVLPELLFELLENYGGLGINENCYIDEINNIEWRINEFCDFSMIYGHIEELLEENLNKNILPFAIDRGGWFFCISLEKEEYSAVYIYKIINYSGNEPLLKISNTLEEFINGLIIKEEEE